MGYAINRVLLKMAFSGFNVERHCPFSACFSIVKTSFFGIIECRSPRVKCFHAATTFARIATTSPLTRTTAQ